MYILGWLGSLATLLRNPFWWRITLISNFGADNRKTLHNQRRRQTYESMFLLLKWMTVWRCGVSEKSDVDRQDVELIGKWNIRHVFTGKSEYFIIDDAIPSVPVTEIEKHEGVFLSRSRKDLFLDKSSTNVNGKVVLLSYKIRALFQTKSAYNSIIL